MFIKCSSVRYFIEFLFIASENDLLIRSKYRAFPSYMRNKGKHSIIIQYYTVVQLMHEKKRELSI